MSEVKYRCWCKFCEASVWQVYIAYTHTTGAVLGVLTTLCVDRRCRGTNYHYIAHTAFVDGEEAIRKELVR